MKRGLKIYLICLTVALAVTFTASTGMAQFFGAGTIWNLPAFSTQPQVVPTSSPTTGDILVDNFEYWDSPYNHGWMQSEPDYPVYGFGMGYATTFNTVLDLQQGSRVLDVYRPASIFLIGTQYAKHFISLFLPTTSTEGGAGINLDPNSDDPSNAVLSFKFRAPLGIEPWDIFEFLVIGTTLGEDGTAGTDDDRTFQIRISPVQPSSGSGTSGSATSFMGTYQASLIQAGSGNSPMVIQVNIGRNFLDGSWHTIWLDLIEINQKAHNGSVPTEWQLSTALQVMAGGQMFRMDDIMFRFADYTRLDQPDFFEIGPLYAQIFEPYRYLFMADYHADSDIPHLGPRQIITDFMLDGANFITDPDEITEAWLQDSNVAGVIQMDPNYLDPNHASYGNPEPYYTGLLGRDFVIDITLPVFSDPNIRMAGSQVSELLNQGTLGWNVTVNGYGANAIQAFLVEPLAINPYDGMPTYIPAYYSGIAAIKAHGKPQYSPVLCFILESALWNSGMRVWPNIAYMDYTPQYFEDLIITIEVTDGRRSDVRTIPMSVVNYPVENYSPVAQIYASPKIFYVGEPSEYLIKFIDPDCFIFSLAQFLGREPATTHIPGFPVNDWGAIRNDQDGLTYSMTLNGLASYQYGPWVQSMIDPCSGLINFTPQFEGLYTALITSTDNRGGIGFEDFPLLIVQSGTWLNHPPFITGCPTRPVVVKAGEEVMIGSPDFIVTDPDGDQLYASTNIGSVGQTADGGFMWTFQSNFPGTYNVEVLFYDIRGGYAVMRFLMDVKPWWSY